MGAEMRRHNFGVPAKGKVRRTRKWPGENARNSTRRARASSFNNRWAKQWVFPSNPPGRQPRYKLQRDSTAASTGDLKTNFSCFVGVANAFGFEAIVFITIVVVWLAWRASP